MTYDTKVILQALADAIIKSESAKQLYDYIADLANVEGVIIIPYEDARKRLKQSEFGSNADVLFSAVK